MLDELIGTLLQQLQKEEEIRLRISEGKTGEEPKIEDEVALAPYQQLRRLIYEGKVDIIEIPKQIRVWDVMLYQQALQCAIRTRSKKKYDHVQQVVEADIMCHPSNFRLKTFYQDKIVEQPWQYWVNSFKE